MSVRKKRIQDISYEEAYLEDLRSQGHDEQVIEIMRLWLQFSPEEKRGLRIAMETMFAASSAQAA